MTLIVRNTYWTQNRLSIFVPWMAPLVVSVFLAPFNLAASFIVFLVLSLMARIVVVVKSPFWKTTTEDFKERLKEDEFTLENGMVLSSKEIRKARYWMFFSLAVAFFSLKTLEFIPVLFPEIKRPLDPSLVPGMFVLFLFVYQALFKSYLIAKDLPLNGFPFLRSSNKGVVSRGDIRNSVNDIRHPMNPLNPGNIGNPANINYVFKDRL